VARPKYDVHPSVTMMKRWRDELPAKTGRSLEAWAELLTAALPDAPAKERTAWLKTVHGLGGNTAGQICAFSADRQTWDGDPASYLAKAHGYVAAQYAGPKATLWPIAEAVLTLARKMGRDVKVCPCQTILPIYRGRAFAEPTAATRTRVDLHLALGDFPAARRLAVNPQRAKRDGRLAHRVPLTAVGDVDAEVAGRLREAYTRGG
jgi:hypothetical protein